MVRTSKPALIFHASPRASGIHLTMVPTAELHLSTFLNPDRFAVGLTKSDFLERCIKNWVEIHRIPRVLGAIRQSALQDRLKQLLRLPLAARVKKILRAPTAVLAAVGPDDTSQAAPAQADQGTERLAHTAMKRALLGKDTAPVLGDGEKRR